MTRRIIAGALASLAVLAWSCDRGTPRAEPVACYEDMPCWDCETMGNKVCGVEP